MKGVTEEIKGLKKQGVKGLLDCNPKKNFKNKKS